MLQERGSEALEAARADLEELSAPLLKQLKERGCKEAEGSLRRVIDRIIKSNAPGGNAKVLDPERSAELLAATIKAVSGHKPHIEGALSKPGLMLKPATNCRLRY